MQILNNLLYSEEYNGRTYKSQMRHDQLYAALGLNPKRHLPDAGLPPQLVGNVEVWVDAKIPGKNQDAKRVWCKCPACGKVLTAGKLQQHRKVHK